ncbi:hypothetical protein SBD_2901 [Streptomyces bottropensis ATCC 25435]|uniref:Uncharacterized protein n=1 Tax=Streptomyces bottropensis ATCC 25435 TaxID=1054862 RepID=M3F226_9ACTN|nr:hypothetical protein SBD_2901 [Streptomyces bottropensis ATCC 25435]
MVSSETVAHTVPLGLGGAAVAGLVALVGWPFGRLPGPGLPALGLSIPASRPDSPPGSQLYRDARPPRRRTAFAAALTAFLTPATVPAPGHRPEPGAARHGRPGHGAPGRLRPRDPGRRCCAGPIARPAGRRVIAVGGPHRAAGDEFPASAGSAL